MKPVYAALEAGGTKMNCAIGRWPQGVIARRQFPTKDPESTLANLIDFFREAAAAHGEIAAVGIACFGPVELDPGRAEFGHITATPKPGWANTDLVGPLKAALGVPVAFETDVNGAALGEGRWGAAQGLSDFVYVTVGTGIGGGVIAGGKAQHGLIHPEIGHMRIMRDRAADPFGGNCPFHGDCLEGLAAGPAIAARWNKPADTLAADHQAWDLEAYYLAQMCHNLTVMLSPQRIILGGGVMNQGHLFAPVREKFAQLLGGYLPVAERAGGLANYIVPPGLGADAGLAGAFHLAEMSSREAAATQ